MTDRSEVASRVAKRLGLNIGADLIGGPYFSGTDALAIWDALISSEQHVEELEEALRQIDGMLKGQLPITGAVKEIAQAALSPKRPPLNQESK